MHSVAVYLVQRPYGGPEDVAGTMIPANSAPTRHQPPASSLPRVTRTTAGRWRCRFRRISIAIGTSVITRSRSAVSSALVASRPTSTMAGPLSPFRPSVPATNDTNRSGLPFCQPSRVRSHEDLHRPLSNTLPITVAEITVEAEDVVSACRSACRCVAYDRRVEEPRYGASHVYQRLSLKVRTSILGALSLMATLPPSCPSRACSCKWRRARAMPQLGVRIWSTRSAS